MKKCFFSLMLFAAAACIAAPLPRSIRIGSAPLYALTGNNCAIVIAPGAPRTVKFAASQMQELLSAVLGAKIPVTTAPAAGKHNIRLGLTPDAAKAGLVPEKLARDGFYIKTVGSDIFIAGIDDPKTIPETEIARGGAWALYEHATLFGVYDFLERFAGVRFYFPGELGTILPKKGALSIPSIDIIERPDFKVRSYSAFTDGIYFEGDKRDAIINPRKNLNMLRYRFHTEYLPCCHGIQGFGFVHRFGKSHPEYFALMSNGKRYNDPDLQFPGQLCWTSGIREEIYQDLKSYFSGKPASERGVYWNKKVCWAFPYFRKPYVDIMPQDSFYRCSCQKCEAAYDRDKGRHYATTLIWDHVTAMGRRLKKEGIPGQLNMMAYPPYRAIPKVEIPDNINVMVAEGGPWCTSPKAIAEQDGEIIAWSKKLGRKVWLWNYVNKLGTTELKGVPAPTPRAVGAYYQRVSPYIFGAFMESECDRFLYFHLNFYIFEKVAWNNKFDYGKALDEYYKLMFGPASATMQKIMERFEEIWLKKIYGRVVDTPLGPVAAVPSDYDLWHQIYSPEMIAQITAEFDLAAKQAGKETLFSKRIALFRREFLEPLTAAAKEYLAKTNAVKGVFFRFGGDPIHLAPASLGNGKIKPGLVDTKISASLNARSLDFTIDCEEPKFAETVAVQRKYNDPDCWRDNSVEIFVNPSGDRRHYYQLIINSKGCLTDYAWDRPGKNNVQDPSWHSDAKAAVIPVKGGFQVKVSIPRASLPGLKETGFPVNFGRSRILVKQGSEQAYYCWSRYANGFHDLENYGMLTAGKEIILDPGFDIFKSTFSPRCWGYYKKGTFYGWYGEEPTAQNYAKQVNDVYFSAPSSMKLVSGDGKKGILIGQTLTGKLKPDTTYRLSFKVKLENVVKMRSGASGFCINLWDDANRWFPEGRWLDGTMDWTYLSFTHKTSKKLDPKKGSSIRARLMNCTGTAWLDDLSIEEVK